MGTRFATLHKGQRQTPLIQLCLSGDQRSATEAFHRMAEGGIGVSVIGRNAVHVDVHDGTHRTSKVDENRDQVNEEAHHDPSPPDPRRNETTRPLDRGQTRTNTDRWATS